MKNTHCCQCGAPRKVTQAPVANLSRHDILVMKDFRTINSNPAPGVMNEMSPQLFASFSMYRNGGTDSNTHICDECFVVGLKHIQCRVTELLDSLNPQVQAA